MGVRKRSGEIWVATKTGEIKSVRSVKRIPEEERWSKDNVGWVKHTLWHRYKGDPEEDGEVPEGRVVDVESDKEKEEVKEKREGVGVTVKMKEVKTRDFHMRKDDAERLGYTRGCAGCTSWFKGLRSHPTTTSAESDSRRR